MELHEFQGINISTDKAVFIRLVDHKVVIAHAGQYPLPLNGLLGTHEKAGHHIVAQIPCQQTPHGTVGHLSIAGRPLDGTDLLLTQHHMLRPLGDQRHIAPIGLHGRHSCPAGIHIPLHGTHAALQSV